jgi:hypothetical protein
MSYPFKENNIDISHSISRADYDMYRVDSWVKVGVAEEEYYWFKVTKQYLMQFPVTNLPKILIGKAEEIIWRKLFDKWELLY